MLRSNCFRLGLPLLVILGSLVGCDVAPAPVPAADRSSTQSPGPASVLSPSSPAPSPDPCAELDCDDGLFCNGEETCEDGICREGTDPCPGQFCDRTLRACKDCRFDADCDDDLFCNGSETCVDGSCLTGASPCSEDLSCNEAHRTCLAPFTLRLAGCPSESVPSGAEVRLTALVSGGLDEHTHCSWSVIEGDATLSSTRSETTTVQTEGDDPLTVEVTVMDQEAVDGEWRTLSSAVALCTVTVDASSTPIVDFAAAPVSGIVPLNFGASGGSFEISVSPVNSAGELLTQGIAVDNFTFSELTVTPLDAPSTVIATGDAAAHDLTIIEPSDPNRGVTVAILLDSTGSMSVNDPKRIRVEAAKNLVSILDHGDEAAVGDFQDCGQTTPGFRTLRLLQDFTSDHGLLITALEKVVARCSTPFYDALLDGIDLLVQHSTRNPAIVVLTDGLENASREGTFASVVRAAVSVRIPIFPIGLGTSVNFTELQRLAEETGGTFASALNADELRRLFENLGVAVTAGRVVVHADIAFDPPLPSSGVFTVSGLLETEVGDVIRDSPFSFQIELGPH